MQNNGSCEIRVWCFIASVATLKQQDAFCLKESTLYFSPSLFSALWNRFKKIKKGRDEYSEWFQGLELVLKNAWQIKLYTVGKEHYYTEKSLSGHISFLAFHWRGIELPEISVCNIRWFTYSKSLYFIRGVTFLRLKHKMNMIFVSKHQEN